MVSGLNKTEAKEVNVQVEIIDHLKDQVELHNQKADHRQQGRAGHHHQAVPYRLVRTRTLLMSPR